jgi:CO dehydrogenase/acetyl-CoA synthase beta subunit
MTDETTQIYYSCTLCQSFAPNQVCVVSPERTGLCGAYNWMDCEEEILPYLKEKKHPALEMDSIM